jgi:hypothetical protein
MAARNDFKVMNKKAPFFRLIDFVEKHSLFEEYKMGVSWMFENVQKFPLIESEKEELKSVLSELMFLEEK